MESEVLLRLSDVQCIWLDGDWGRGYYLHGHHPADTLLALLAGEEAPPGGWDARQGYGRHGWETGDFGSERGIWFYTKPGRGRFHVTAALPRDGGRYWEDEGVPDGD